MSESTEKSAISLFQRIGCGICGLTFFGLAGWVIAVQKRAELDVFTVLFPLVMIAAGGFLLWASFFYRPPSRTELELLDTSLLPDRSDDALICRFTWFGSRVRLAMADFGKKQIYFRNCHTPRKFLAVAQDEFSCSFAELVAVYRYQFRGDSLTIVTTQGKALVPSTATDYEQLCARLPSCVPPNPPVVDTENPLVGIVYVAGALVGLFLGLVITPQNASAGLTALCMAAGAGTTIFPCHLAIVYANRIWKRSVVPVLAAGIACAFVGAYVGSLVASKFDGSVWPLVAGGVFGGAAGVGCAITRGKQKPGKKNPD